MQYDLVFEGGGAKGMVFVGALQEFEAAGHTFDRLLGTSAGAITAALLAAGYNSQRMLEALAEEEEDGRPVFAGFMGTPGPFGDAEIRASATADFLKEVDIPLLPESLEEKLDLMIVKGLLKITTYKHLFSFVEQGGWFSATKFLDWMTMKLDTAEDGSSTGFGAMTLSQFFDATDKELCLIASDTTAQRMLVLNHHTAPDCPLVWSVRMSMSIPLVWPEVVWQKEWGLYRGQTAAGHTVVDGGMLSNFPIELFVSHQPQVTAVMGNKRSEHVLGLLIDETRPVPGAPVSDAAKGGLQWGKLRTAQRVMALIDTMTNAHDKEVVEAFEELVTRLPAQGYGTTEFGMTAERRDALVAAGREAMKEHFARAAAPRARGIEALPSDTERGATIADKIATAILAR